MKRILAAFAALTMASVQFAFADVKLAGLFADNMVLQRDAKVAIWGTAEPGEQVTVEVGLEGTHLNPSGRLGSHWDLVRPPAVTADADGRWRVEFGPLRAVKITRNPPADAGRFGALGPPTPPDKWPQTDRLVRITVTGKNTVTLNNILIGDVWLCSGQSNMAMSVASSANAKEEIAAADLPNIRLFTVPRRPAEQPAADVAGPWVACGPKTVGPFSAVGYFFGRDLHKALDVPIGLIHSSWGGTAAELWTSAEGLADDEALKGFLLLREERMIRHVAAQSDYQKLLAAWEKAAKQAAAAGQPPPAKPKAPPSLGLLPTGLYNGMIAPLVGFRIAGTIWYQGEANAGDQARAGQYDILFPAMIRDWRKQWGYDFPFLFVQLANYKQRRAEPGESAWARLREAQLKTLALPATGMAVIIDVGDAGDIHPKNKQDVGKRLALAARAVAHGQKDVVFSGPIFKAMKVEGERVRLSFDHVGGGLLVRARADEPSQNDSSATGAPPLAGFAVAGADRKFVRAEAKIEGDQVVVWSAQVAGPVAVRYGWADNPDCNLYNKEGLPASPFRTDGW